MRPALSSRTKRRGATALAPALRLVFLTASDMWHPYGDLTRNWSALDPTVPRILATILNGTIVAGMVVLLLAVVRRGSSLATHLHISHAKDVFWHRSMTGSQMDFATADMRTARAPLDSLPQRLP